MDEYRGPTCSHPHNLPHNDECAVWWLRGTPQWRLAHTRLGCQGTCLLDCPYCHRHVVDVYSHLQFHPCMLARAAS